MVVTNTSITAVTKYTVHSIHIVPTSLAQPKMGIVCLAFNT